MIILVYFSTSPVEPSHDANMHHCGYVCSKCNYVCLKSDME